MHKLLTQQARPLHPISGHLALALTQQARPLHPISGHLASMPGSDPPESSFLLMEPLAVSRVLVQVAHCSLPCMWEIQTEFLAPG